MTETAPTGPQVSEFDLRAHALQLAVDLWKDRPVHGLHPSEAVALAAHRFYEFLSGETLSDNEISQLDRIERIVMATQQEVDALTAEVQSASTAIQTEIANLEAQVAGENVDLTGLKAAADQLSAIGQPATPPSTPAGS